MEFLKSLEWVMENIEKDTVRIIDCRFDLKNPDQGNVWYKDGHIPGSIYFHLETDLSDPVSDHGGRHPLPDIQTLVKKLESIGIDEHTTVIAYDHGELAHASRCWWLLTYLGHPNTYILDGGYKGWVSKGYPLTKKIPSFTPTTFYPSIQTEMAASYDDVFWQVKMRPHDRLLIDSRDPKRYSGEVEPIDKKSGHIPGAINIDWAEGVKDGYFLSARKQKERLSFLDKNKEYIVYCGSGITAIPNYISLKMAGIEKVKLYPGSFSDWISYDENEVEVETNVPSQAEK